MLQTKVAIVGAGPVGLLASLLLQQHSVDFVCLEKMPTLRAHPSAHWISARTKRILSQIPSLAQRMDEVQEPFEQFSHYRYVEAVGGQQFGATNHFAPSIDQAMKMGMELFQQKPNHLSQNRFVKILYEFVRDRQRVFLDRQVTELVKEGQKWQLKGTDGSQLCQADYVILSDGFTSRLRDNLGIKMGGGKDFYKLINIHFKSKTLADRLLTSGTNAMLHFVYNNRIPCVLVNHSYKQGEFVLQVPNYEPFLDLLDAYSPEALLKSAIDSEIWDQIQSDLEIVNVGRWKLQAQLANTMVKDGIFLAGDTAHSYTPAGGFGMNCGLQDANQLVHTLLTLFNNPKADANKLAHQYNSGRLAANHKYLTKSLQNYTITQQTANQLGLPPSLTEYYFKAAKMSPLQWLTPPTSFVERARQVIMGQLFKPGQIKPTLPLIFDQFDASVQRHSVHAQQIIDEGLKGNSHDVWVDHHVPHTKISALFGELNPENILRRELNNGQKIVRRDGIVLL